MTESKTEYGLRIDCAAQGCDPKHGDDGEVVRRRVTERFARTVNGHAAVSVKRVVVYSDWVEVEG